MQPSSIADAATTENQRLSENLIEEDENLVPKSGSVFSIDIEGLLPRRSKI
jgi:hypothetical protein